MVLELVHHDNNACSECVAPHVDRHWDCIHSKPHRTNCHNCDNNCCHNCDNNCRNCGNDCLNFDINQNINCHNYNEHYCSNKQYLLQLKSGDHCNCNNDSNINCHATMTATATMTHNISHCHCDSCATATPTTVTNDHNNNHCNCYKQRLQQQCKWLYQHATMTTSEKAATATTAPQWPLYLQQQLHSCNWLLLLQLWCATIT